MGQVQLLDVFPERDNSHVMYNVRREQVPDYKVPNDPSWEYVCRISSPPPIASGEYEAVEAAVLDCIFSELVDSECPPYDAVHESTDPIIPEKQCDRTIPIFAPSLIYITIHLVERLQSEVLCKYPMWRVVIYDDDVEEYIAIYPDIAHFGTTPRTLPSSQAIAEWRSKAAERRNTEEFAALIDMFRRIEPLISSARARLPEGEMVVLALYNNVRGDVSKHALWVLQRNAPNRRVVECDPDMSCCQHGNRYPILADDRIGVSSSTSPIDMYVVKWILPAMSRHSPFGTHFELGAHMSRAEIRNPDRNLESGRRF